MPSHDAGQERLPATVAVSLVAWIAASLSLITAIPFACLILAMPKVEQMFKDLGMTLPGITDLLISAHRNGLLWIGLAVILIATVLVPLLLRDWRVRITIPLVCLFLNLLGTTFIAAGTFLPLIRMVEQLGKSQGT